MDQYAVSWMAPTGRPMSLVWCDESDHCIRFLLSAIRDAGGVVTAATIEATKTIDLLAEPVVRPAHPPTT